ncbi:hypothetical protein DFR36_101490 [Melaminivora alkalimesophila]|uniref:Uncharacterized protein n=2 Tax=Melaminivora alkalimesophila TaxID=1165852 RepID=A0A317RGE0_9BURK|nr:hypothetical protein DFR36_101490 [Melaminivora alkalimesophila]
MLRMNPTPTDFSQGAAYVRGQYVPIDQAAVPITDWGFLRSDAAYDVVTVWDGVPIGGGQVGPITRRLVETYWAWHRDGRYSTPVRYAD